MFIVEMVSTNSALLKYGMNYPKTLDIFRGKGVYYR